MESPGSAELELPSLRERSGARSYTCRCVALRDCQSPYGSRARDIAHKTSSFHELSARRQPASSSAYLAALTTPAVASRRKRGGTRRQAAFSDDHTWHILGEHSSVGRDGPCPRPYAPYIRPTLRTSMVHFEALAMRSRRCRRHVARPINEDALFRSSAISLGAHDESSSPNVSASVAHGFLSA